MCEALEWDEVCVYCHALNGTSGLTKLLEPPENPCLCDPLTRGCPTPSAPLEKNLVASLSLMHCSPLLFAISPLAFLIFVVALTLLLSRFFPIPYFLVFVIICFFILVFLIVLLCSASSSLYVSVCSFFALPFFLLC
ncbi:uncharacterized protein BJ212DRAFT_1497635 [Suillus subaureus]|uniref:Uncharacterized protein n=1 Tax=Suillus subaureus TaxID=48587 RepID=A0A9P7EDP8_9AGAM|nr:uncharacterized protein BJ212DRAFT_1497635 [Suillus subaureus]KAG1818678.1 hypothetical protein BJ212DRAFT_1497635 [Suillus subaureus]